MGYTNDNHDDLGARNNLSLMLEALKQYRHLWRIPNTYRVFGSQMATLNLIKLSVRCSSRFTGDKVYRLFREQRDEVGNPDLLHSVWLLACSLPQKSTLRRRPRDITRFDSRFWKLLCANCKEHDGDRWGSHRSLVIKINSTSFANCVHTVIQ